MSLPIPYAELSLKIEEVSVLPANTKMTAVQVLATGEQNPHSLDSHEIYRVTLKIEEIYAVDPACAEFGHTQPISP
jgi:hypothetical protein